MIDLCPSTDMIYTDTDSGGRRMEITTKQKEKIERQISEFRTVVSSKDSWSWEKFYWVFKDLKDFLTGNREVHVIRYNSFWEIIYDDEDSKLSSSYHTFDEISRPDMTWASVRIWMIFSIENFETFMMHLLKIFYKRFHFWMYRLRGSSHSRGKIKRTNIEKCYTKSLLKMNS